MSGTFTITKEIDMGDYNFGGAMRAFIILALLAGIVIGALTYGILSFLAHHLHVHAGWT